MTSAEMSLTERLDRALGGHDVNLLTRSQVQQAYLAAGGDAATFADLPPDIQALVQRIEKLPPTSWADPSDVPDDVQEPLA